MLYWLYTFLLGKNFMSVEKYTTSTGQVRTALPRQVERQRARSLKQHKQSHADLSCASGTLVVYFSVDMKILPF